LVDRICGQPVEGQRGWELPSLPLAIFDKETTMTRTMRLLSLLVFGGALLAATGCEDTVCKEALNKATTAKAEAQKSAESLDNEVTTLKAKLAASEKNLEAAVKAADEAKEAVAKAQEKKPAKHKGKKGKRRK
jgi:hypothetical protein